MNNPRITARPRQPPGASPWSSIALGFLFLALVALTLGEVGLTTVAASHQVRVTGLAGLGMVKGALILWFFMHLGQQPRWLRRAVILPLLLTAVFLVVLMLDGVVRLRGGP
ncbi:MAG TPA: cytochrome C oxidase subunit IV family protein [Polyangia bacterium]|nr:cytochrome C oxidase subunit IV family protein [Polyangia bacterium]